MSWNSRAFKRLRRLAQQIGHRGAHRRRRRQSALGVRPFNDLESLEQRLLLSGELPTVWLEPVGDSPESGTVVGGFNLHRDGMSGDLAVALDLTAGKATAGVDYQTIDTSATIPDGESSVFIPVAALDDSDIEGGETVELSIADDAAYIVDSAAGGASISVLDDDLAMVAVSVVDGVASETPDDSDTGTIRFTRSGTGLVTEGDLMVHYRLAGAGFDAGDIDESITGTVTIPDGQASVDWTLTPAVDAAEEWLETVVVSVVADDAYERDGAVGRVALLDADMTLTPHAAVGDGAAGDEVGASVAIDGQWLFVGAPGHSGDAGAVYVYRYVAGGPWTLEQTLTAGDGAPGDAFGTSVDASEGYLIVGAPHADDGAVESTGAAYIYHYEQDAWTPQQAISNFDATSYDRLGRSVAINGDWAVVGIDGYDGVSWSEIGAADVYRRDGSAWVHSDRLIPDNPMGYYTMGYSVDLQGDRVVLGAILYTEYSPGMHYGAVFVHEYTGGQWQETDIVADEWGYEQFGSSVDLDIDRMAVGAMGNNSVYVYDYTAAGQPWHKQTRLTASDGGSLGGSVAIDGSLLLAGASSNDRVYVFEEDAGGTWHEVGVIAPGSAEGLGASVDLDGTWMFGGAPGDAQTVGEAHGVSLAPRVNGWQINGGDAQRSWLSSVSVTFNQPVNSSTIDAGDLSMHHKTTGLAADISGATVSYDADDDALSYEVTAWPAHGVLEMGSDGQFTYVSQADYLGVDVFTVRAFDGEAYSEPAEVELLITSTDPPPRAIGMSLAIDEDTPFSGPLVGIDARGDVLTFDVASPPTSGTLEVNSDGWFTYTPDEDYHGGDQFTFTVDDGGQTSIATVSFDIQPVNDAPTAQGQSFAATEDTPLNANLPAATDPDTGETITYTAATGPTHGTLAVNPGGSFTYTPDANYHGPDSFTYTASDGALSSAPTTITIDVASVDDGAPVADDTAFSIDEDAVHSATLSAVDHADDVGALTFTLESDADHGTVTVAADGTFTYIPDEDYHGGHDFAYRATDGDGSYDLGLVTITVTPVNDAPAVPHNDIELSMTEDAGPVSSTLQATDVESDPLTFVIALWPEHGTLTLDDPETGAVTYTPDADFFGTDRFRYTASDGTLESGTGTVTITVDPMDDAPVAAADVYQLPAGHDTLDVAWSKAGLLANDIEPDRDSVTVTLVTGPGKGTLTSGPSGDGTFTYLRDSGAFGQDTFRYAISDGMTSVEATVTIDLPDATNAAPIAPPEALTYGATLGADLTVSERAGLLSGAEDPDGDFMFVVPDAGVTAVGPNGSTGTVAVDRDGSFTLAVPPANIDAGDFDEDGLAHFEFDYQLSDGALQTTASASVALRLQPVRAADHEHYTDRNRDLAIDAVDGLFAGAASGNNQPLTVIAAQITSTSGGSVTVTQGTGAFTYTPPVGFVGEDTFDFTISDTTTSEQRTVTVHVENTAPIPVSDAMNMRAADGTLSIPVDDLLANDFDAEDDTLALVSITGDDPDQGTWAWAGGTADIVFDPAPDFIGVATASYLIRDTVNAGAAPQTLESETLGTVSVLVEDLQPLARDDVYAVDAGRTLNIALEDGLLANDLALDEGATLTIDSYATSPAGSDWSVNMADGSFTFAAPEDFAGEIELTYTITDGTEISEPATVTFTVIDTAPVAVDDALEVPHDQPLTILYSDLLANDLDDEDELSGLSVVPLTELDTVHGTLSVRVEGDGLNYTPAPGFVGLDRFRYRVSDGLNESELASVLIAITNAAPEAGDRTLVLTEDDTALAGGFAAGVTDVDDADLTYAIVAGPFGGELTSFNETTGAFTYASDPDFHGTDTLLFSVTDPLGAVDQATVTFDIASVNDPPTVPALQYTVEAGDRLAADVLFEATDPEFDVLTAALASLTTPATLNHGTLESLESEGRLIYEANANAADGAIDTFDVTISDGDPAQDVIRTITITIANAAPVAVDDGYSVATNASLSVGQLAGVASNDTDERNDLLDVSLEPGGDVSHGTLTLNTDGSFTYAPDTDFAGADQFTYTLTDAAGQVSGSATVTLTVSSASVIARPDRYATIAGKSMTVPLHMNVLRNDTGATAASLVQGSESGDGSVAFNADGTFTYTPATIDVDHPRGGQFTFQYTPDGGATTATVTIDLTNNMPVATDDAYALVHDTSIGRGERINVLANDFDADRDDLIAVLLDGAGDRIAVSDPDTDPYRAFEQPEGMLRLYEDGTFTFAPTDLTAGTVTFDYRVFDGSAASLTATPGPVGQITFDIDNAPPVGHGDRYVFHHSDLVEGVSGQPVDTDFDPDGDSLVMSSIDATNLSSFISFSDDGTTFTFTAQVNEGEPGHALVNHSTSFTYQPHDGIEPGDPVSVTLEVWNAEPTGNDDTFYIHHTEHITGKVLLANDGLTSSSGGWQDWDGDDLEVYLVDPLTGDPLSTINTPAAGSASVDKTTGALTYAPPSGTALEAFYDEGHDRGVDVFYYVLKDGPSTSTPIPVSIHVTDFAPAVRDLIVISTNGAAVSGSVADARIDHDETLGRTETYSFEVFDKDAGENGEWVTPTGPINTDYGTVDFTAAGGTFAYTPALDGVDADVRADGFLFRATDGVRYSNPAVVNIELERNEIAAIDDFYVALAGETLDPDAARNVLDNDYFRFTDDGADPLLAISVDGSNWVEPGNDLDTEHAGTVNLAADGTFSYTPAADYPGENEPVGSESFHYRVTDPNDGIVSRGTVHLHIVPGLVGVTNESYEVDLGETLSLSAPGVLESHVYRQVDQGAPPDAIAILLDGAQGSEIAQEADGSRRWHSGHGTFTLFENGELTYSHTDTAFSGVDTAYYKLRWGNVTKTAWINVHINDARPTAVDDAPIPFLESDFDDDGYIEISIDTLLNNDTDGSDSNTLLDPSTFEITSTPWYGTVALHPAEAPTTVRYTPTAELTTGLTDRFTYRIKDTSGLTSPAATVTLQFDSVDDDPIYPRDDRATTLEDTAVTIDVLANDIDIDNPGAAILPADVSIQLSDLPAGHTATVNDGQIVFTPAADFNGEVTFSYDVTSNQIPSTTAGTVTVTVGPVNDAPAPPASTTLIVEEDAEGAILAAALFDDPDVFDDVPRFVEITSHPSYGTVHVEADRTIRYIPDPDHDQGDSFTYLAYDHHWQAVEVTINVSVTSENDAPVFWGDEFTQTSQTAVYTPFIAPEAGSSRSIDLLDYARDPEGEVLSIVNGSLAVTPSDSVNVSLSGSVLTFSRNGSNFEDSTKIAFSITDGTNTVPASISLAAARDGSPAALDTPYSIGSGGSLYSQQTNTMITWQDADGGLIVEFRNDGVHVSDGGGSRSTGWFTVKYLEPPVADHVTNLFWDATVTDTVHLAATGRLLGASGESIDLTADSQISAEIWQPREHPVSDPNAFTLGGAFQAPLVALMAANSTANILARDRVIPDFPYGDGLLCSARHVYLVKYGLFAPATHE